MKLITADFLATSAIEDDRFSVTTSFEEHITHLAIVDRETGDMLNLTTKTYPTTRRASATLTRNGKTNFAYDLTCFKFLAGTL